ncbi:alpha/beta-hydrolase [Diplogelasinospora grovesii]|uniref:Alpha/beta-hydrolase n=1 Tax=Diplogelasinospora grovesii TaxID=303347 RepID=A0AAN6S6J0_9PEZI|nr:alpha/beta-hydrolase [Diplogelasinospora grovesii]
MVDKLTPTDTRVEHHTAAVNGKTYHYLLGTPSTSSPAGTVLLVHGWPDLSFGWRYQVPFLLSQGYRVIVPDMLGYGRSDAPESLSEYSLKSMSDDMAALCKHVLGDCEGQVILGGHDWGGALVWRIALWHPELLKAVFSVCTPYPPPRDMYISPEMLVQMLPNFKYQLQLGGPDVQREIVGKEKLRQLLNGIYGGRGPNREPAFSTEKGVLFENLDKIGQSPLLTPEETSFYVQEYERHGMRGPLNWYRTGKINFEEELELVKDGRVRVTVPGLIIAASKDGALPPSMSVGMEKHFDKGLTKREVNASHWALWEAPAGVNKYIGEFLEGVLKGESGESFKASI